MIRTWDSHQLPAHLQAPFVTKILKLAQRIAPHVCLSSGSEMQYCDFICPGSPIPSQVQYFLLPGGHIYGCNTRFVSPAVVTLSIQAPVHGTPSHILQSRGMLHNVVTVLALYQSHQACN